MKQVVYFTIFLFFIQSCSNKEISDYSLENVPLIIDIDSVKIVELKVNHVQYIPLETTDDCLIGTASKVLIKNERIYVADFHMAMAIFIFDMTGKFLFKIDKRGQGPGEYIYFDDFDIQSNGDIYIHDSWGKKFIIYSPEGKYIQDIRADYYFLGFCLFSNKIYLSTLYDRKMFANLAVYDMIDKKTELLLKDKKFLDESDITNFNSYKFYYSPDSIVYYSPKFSEIIFSIDGDGTHPAIGIKNLRIPSKEQIEKWVQEGKKNPIGHQIWESHYFIQNINVYETDKYITFTPVNYPHDFMLLYNKQSKYSCFIYNQYIGTGKVRGSIGKYFFGVITFNPDGLDGSRQKKILASREELKNWQEDDNPVIVIFEPDN